MCTKVKPVLAAALDIFGQKQRRQNRVLVRLQGGLGNQLFQYAAAYNLARRNNLPLKLDLGWFRKNPQSVTVKSTEEELIETAPPFIPEQLLMMDLSMVGSSNTIAMLEIA